MEIYKNPLFYGTIFGLATYIYFNYISLDYCYDEKYTIFYPLIIFILSTFISLFVVNNSMEQTTKSKLYIPKTIEDLPDIFVHIR